MRMLTFCLIAFATTLAGCNCQECGSTAKKSTSEAKSSETECTSDDCCSTVSRAAILQKGAATDNASTTVFKTVKFDAFMKDVKANQGKIVCAYLWSDAHVASKKNLPFLLELQRKFGKDVVVVTVNNDPAKAASGALKSLENAKGDLVHYRQDDNDTVDGWTSCFGCCGFPGMVVFGRDGKKAASFEVTELPFDAKAIEPTLVKLLDVK